MVKGGLRGSACVCAEGAGEVSHLQAADCAALMTLDAQLLEEKTRINWWGVCNADYCDYLWKSNLCHLCHHGAAEMIPHVIWECWLQSLQGVASMLLRGLSVCMLALLQSRGVLSVLPFAFNLVHF